LAYRLLARTASGGQFQQERTPPGTAQVVRQILERQIRGAAEDVARFAD
jgi:hypothetical protein